MIIKPDITILSSDLFIQRFYNYDNKRIFQVYKINRETRKSYS